MINVKVMGEDRVFEDNTTFAQVASQYSSSFKYPIMLAQVGNQVMSLTSKIEEGMNITFFDRTDKEGFRVFTRGLSMILVKAVRDIYGLEHDVIIENSINKNFYCEFDDKKIEPTEDVIKNIENKMREIIAQDFIIERKELNKYKAIKMFEKQGFFDKASMFRYRRASNVNYYSIDGFVDYYYGYMPYKTGDIDNFELMKYQNGFLIMFPDENNIINKDFNLAKITDVFMEQMDWCRLMNVNIVADLNDIIAEGRFDELVRINEALHEQKIVSIVDMICEKKDKLKMVLIAGPSSSGKTTFANRLCVQLKVNGITPHVISLDDYFINRADTPLDEFGKHDFESIDALDLKLFNSDMQRLINGERVEIPYYNFVTGKREYRGKFIELKEGEIFVIEGIHALNDRLTASIDDENKFKIFISAMTQLNVDKHNRISTSDSRLIRRIVRDFKFRGNDAKSTIDIWDSVARGENKNIFPYQENADVMFNSTTIYELAVLKLYIEPLLLKIDTSMPEFVTANRILKFLDYFICADSSTIPNNSIMREFVGGSCFHV